MSESDKDKKRAGLQFVDQPFEKAIQHPLAPWRKGSYEYVNGDTYPELEETLAAKKLREKFSDDFLGFQGYRGDAVVCMKRDATLEAIKFLHHDSECLFDLLRDLFVVDILKTPERAKEFQSLGVKKKTRFEVIYNLYSFRFRHDLRLRIPIPEKDFKVDSIVSIYKGANWYEREAWDMFGITFNGHPNLIRILNHENFEGYPLRKDYPINRRHNFTTPKEL